MVVGGRQLVRLPAWLNHQRPCAGAFPHTHTHQGVFMFKHEYYSLSPTNRRSYSYSEPQLYSQNSGGGYFDTQGSSSQVSTVVTSHGMSNNGGGGSGGMSMNLSGGQVISSSPGAYIMDNAAPHPATQTARASPATVSVLAPTHLPTWANHLHPPACFCVSFHPLD